jgi:hypothetical protein
MELYTFIVYQTIINITGMIIIAIKILVDNDYLILLRRFILFESIKFTLNETKHLKLSEQLVM